MTSLLIRPSDDRIGDADAPHGLVVEDGDLGSPRVDTAAREATSAFTPERLRLDPRPGIRPAGMSGDHHFSADASASRS